MSKPRRKYGPVPGIASQSVMASLQPDVVKLLARDAQTNGLTLSGQVHDSLRQFYGLPRLFPLNTTTDGNS